MKRMLINLIATFSLAISLSATANTQVDNICKDAEVWTKIVDQICWSCFTEGFSLMGIGKKPDGASSNDPFCLCNDNLGVPYAGTKLSYFAPMRLIETVRLPWCSPTLGGITLQDDYIGMGTVNASKGKGFWNSHYFAFPLMEMLEILYIDCHQDGYVDLDLM
jgi:conjugal transfer pilus assembly protein TraU